MELLVEEKKGIEKNHQFVQDFKTLADVLIQETVRSYVALEVFSICSCFCFLKEFLVEG